jgi:hypothetical protein
MIRLGLMLGLGLLAGPLAAAPQIFGAEMPAGEALPVSAVLDDPAHFGEPARKFSGRVTEVCQHSGCWMMLEDNGRAVRVIMVDHSFGLPKDASGPAEVHGVLGEIEMSQEAAEHMAQDAGHEHPVERREFRITAYSVSLGGA